MDKCYLIVLVITHTINKHNLFKHTHSEEKNLYIILKTLQKQVFSILSFFSR